MFFSFTEILSHTSYNTTHYKYNAYKSHELCARGPNIKVKVSCLEEKTVQGAAAPGGVQEAKPLAGIELPGQREEILFGYISIKGKSPGNLYFRINTS